MTDLVSLDEVKAHLRVDSDADDSWINTMIPAIGAAVASWLKESWRCYQVERETDGTIVEDSNGEPILVEDSNGLPIVLPLVKIAALIEFAVQYRFRDGDAAPAVPSHAGYGYVLSAGATSLLSGLRKSTVV